MNEDVMVPNESNIDENNKYCRNCQRLGVSIIVTDRNAL